LCSVAGVEVKGKGRMQTYSVCPANSSIPGAGTEAIKDADIGTQDTMEAELT
jgi:hypothetical protein